MCVCRDDGRVKRLSHTLHLCFFCVLLGTLELNWVIIDCGGGATSAPGRGRLRDAPSIESDAAEL